MERRLTDSAAMQAMGRQSAGTLVMANTMLGGSLQLCTDDMIWMHNFLRINKNWFKQREKGGRDD
jgi:hypothetical protein